MQTMHQTCTFSERRHPTRRSLEFASAALLILFIACAGSPLCAHPTLPHLFSDHMVLQRDVEIPVLGWANPGEPISVSLAGKVRETVVGPEGTWRVMLPAAPAGGPFVLLVKGQETITLRDVVIGEV